MKYLKLLIIIGAIAGLFYGVTYLTGNHVTDTSIIHSTPLFARLNDSVEEHWKNAAIWNEDLYAQDLSDAKQNEADLEKSHPGDYKILVERINVLASDKLVQELNHELSKSNCSKEKIKKLHSAIQSHFNDENALPKVKAAKEKIALHDNIVNFGEQTFYIDPNFNANTGKWNSFKNHYTKCLSLRDNLRNNENFKYISNISYIQNAIQVDKRLRTAEKNYWTKLSRQIQDAYRESDQNKMDLDSLKRRYVRYYAEEYVYPENKDKDNSSLSNFKNRMEDINKPYCGAQR